MARQLTQRTLRAVLARSADGEPTNFQSPGFEFDELRELRVKRFTTLC